MNFNASLSVCLSVYSPPPAFLSIVLTSFPYSSQSHPSLSCVHPSFLPSALTNSPFLYLQFQSHSFPPHFCRYLSCFFFPEGSLDERTRWGAAAGHLPFPLNTLAALLTNLGFLKEYQYVKFFFFQIKSTLSDYIRAQCQKIYL